MMQDGSAGTQIKLGSAFNGIEKGTLEKPDAEIRIRFQAEMLPQDSFAIRSWIPFCDERRFNPGFCQCIHGHG